MSAFATSARSAPGVESIDWRRPWLAPYRERGERVAARIAAGCATACALNEEHATGVPRFISAGHLEGEPYESFIARTGCVPTRDNLHDLFNGLVWLRWPRLKRRLNQLHAEQIAREGVRAARGPLRDAATLFDENAALLEAPAALLEALCRRDWNALFVALRADWEDARLTVFGHALLEKLVRPRKVITAHVWLLGAGGFDAIDPGTGPFAPLPVLGVPGWWPHNIARGFYDDALVFRTPRAGMGESPP